MSVLVYVVLFSQGRGLAMNQCPIQGVLSKCLKGFIVSEVYSECEQTRGSNL
jgi:hypothetical protein